MNDIDELDDLPDEIAMPAHLFERLLHRFSQEDAIDLADSYQKGSLAVPEADFAELFAWAWEERPSIAMRLLADLLSGANQHLADDGEITLDQLLDGLRYALHRTKHAREAEYDSIRSRAEVEVPALLAGDDG
ncbi:hypothetical protein RM844_30155 [Streptomyces sp. DSM 44915]|uniref:Uncharacterized protein n=1 Tax=Streptomyces chisholmiae TaxID=3075540 RepID=A0ABU2K1A6_9ACTN|nr:hypothetical protein [Streptomyces sp. DSM 44915]MDT0270544.1 hypothetical protein [Streptomyces sp. DSM 44915]